MKTIAFLLVLITVVGLASATISETTFSQLCQSPSKEVNIEWLVTGVPEGGWYFPLFSKNVKSKFSFSAGSQLAHAPSREKRDESFCPRMTYNDNGQGMVTSNGKTKFVFRCIDNSTATCGYWERRVEVPADLENKTDKIMVVYTVTDNHSYVSMFRCWEDGYNDWQVVSSKKRLSKEQKETILNEAELVGFDRELYYEIDYEQCS